MTRTFGLLAVGVLVGAGAAAQDGPPVEVVAGVLKSIQPATGQLVVVAGEGDNRSELVARAAGVTVRFAGRPAALADLRPGMRVELAYRGNSAGLLEVRARWPLRDAVVKATDPATGAFRVEDDGVEMSLTLAPGAKVTVDELPAGVSDLPVGLKARVELTADKAAALAVDADGPADALPGLVKRYNAATNTLLVEVRAAGFRRDRVTTVGFAVAAGAKVRHAGRDIALTELKERMPVRLTFTPDRRAVAAVLVADPLPPEVNDDD